MLIPINFLPRYWAAIWLTVAGAHWARSTQTIRLRDIDNLYQDADRLFRVNALDDPLSSLDEVRLADIFDVLNYPSTEPARRHSRQ